MKRPFVMVVATMLLFQAAAGAPTPLYVIYQRMWHFSPATVGTVVAGLGYGASGLATFGTMARLAGPIGAAERGELFAVAYAIACLAFSLPALAAGYAGPGSACRPRSTSTRPWSSWSAWPRWRSSTKLQQFRPPPPRTLGRNTDAEGDPTRPADPSPAGR